MVDNTLFDNENVPEVVHDEPTAEEMDSTLASWGVEGEYVPDHDNGIDIPADYNVEEIGNMFEGDTCDGKPYLSEILEREYTRDGEKGIRYLIELVVIDDSKEDAYIVPINLKKSNFEGNVVKNVHHASKLFSLLGGLMELECPGITKTNNRLKNVDLGLIKSKIDKMEYIKFKVIEVEADGFDYNDFRILEGH